MKQAMYFFGLTFTFGFFPISLFADLTVQEGVELKGQILSIKSARKYSTVEGCKAIAEKRSKVVGFKLDKDAGKCYLLKTISGSSPNPEFVSGS
tara:strand:- start:4946 stop:5227 length:282 start_codon:yes stop_codon:yes gene_type:complete